ncbi:two component transcriptional regulator, winged helix family [Phyllobacterium sp. OV277]|jgi:two-component system OmpR family response regulator|nr:two component transcriptional regulator, winged helix family [Phyllobacterium sp. OV277]
MRILVIEDDEKTARFLVRGLNESGHVADHANGGELGLTLALEGIYDVAIIDRVLPGLDGLAVVAELRRLKINLPILMLSGIASAKDRIEGLRSGCDDYLGKPYAFSEILARVQALQRRHDRTAGADILSVGNLTLDVKKRQAARDGSPIDLQNREFLILRTLMQHANEVVTRSMLLEAAWDYDFEPKGNIVDMHIHRLRKKLNSGFNDPILHTVPGAGYLMGKPPKDQPFSDD